MSLSIGDFQKASGIPDNAQLFSFRYVLYSERKILLKQMFENSCITNISVIIWNQGISNKCLKKRDREVHKMDNKNEIIKLINELNASDETFLKQVYIIIKKHFDRREGR